MVVIRLSRGGARKRPFYQMLVTDSRHKRDGRFTERVGIFNPIARGQAIRLQVNLERIDYWLAQGAQPSERVAKLLKEHRQYLTEHPDAVAVPARLPSLQGQKAASATAVTLAAIGNDQPATDS